MKGRLKLHIQTPWNKSVTFCCRTKGCIFKTIYAIRQFM